VNVDTALSRLGLVRLAAEDVLPPAEQALEELEAENAPLPPEWKHRRCRACQVTWNGLPECWSCGKPAAGIGS
jgi:hypothetical protein